MPLGLLRATFRPRRRAELDATREVAAPAEGWLSDAEGMLLYELARACPHRHAVVEIGSWKGRSTIWLAHGARKGAGARVYAIDPHTGSPEHRELLGPIDTLGEFRVNLERARADGQVTALVTTSVDAAAGFAEPVGLAFVDGAHDYESVREDIEAWCPKVVPGGTVAFHDVSGTWPGTWDAVRDHALGSGQFDRVRFVHTIVYARKRSRPSRLAAAIARSVLGYKRVLDACRLPAERLARRLRRT